MIQNVSAKPGFFLNIIRVQSLQGGRITVPVNPAYAPYARFKHVQGIPAQNGGAPLFRLRVLDNLIDRLIRYSEHVPSPSELQNLDPRNIDTMISKLESRLHSRLLQFPSSFGGTFPETGMLIDLSA